MSVRVSPGNKLAQLIAIVSVATLLGYAAPAAAAEYPSWADVEAARNNESAKQAQVGELTGFIASLTQAVSAAQAEQNKRASEYERAQGALDEATYRATVLQGQADEAAGVAANSQIQAGRLTVSIARSGSADDLSWRIFLDEGSESSGLLSRLGTMSKLADQNDLIYERAASERNAAKALAAQADRAKLALGELSAEAEAALAKATAANEELQASLATQQANEAVLRAQLAVLQDGRAATEADYQKGEDARRAAEEAANPDPGPGLDGGQLSDQGWALPVGGWISDSFGPRPNKPVAGVGAFHYGTDIAAGCGVPVYAATSGTVVYADWLGSYGKWVLIDHGNGVMTGYAHNSALLVSNGDTVAAGQNIAEIGTTGASSGCHLHFETRIDGSRIDPEPFMQARGIQIG